MGYQQLTAIQRYQISDFLKSGWTQKRISWELGFHPSTISREIKRNLGKRGYRPRQAHQKAMQRRSVASSRAVICGQAWEEVRSGLQQQWSPEQISGRLKVLFTHRQYHVSHEWIYQHIYADKEAGGELHQHLRCRKKRRKRYGSGRSRRGQIAGRVPIEQRPECVEKRLRIGDWEGDTIIGKGHHQALVSLVDRKSRFTILKKVERKTAPAVASAIVDGLAEHAHQCHTLTLDNGREFTHHQQITRRLGTAVYFAKPYCSWQRGLNENTNGLVRQYAPKNRAFENLPQNEVDKIAGRLNHRPRKSLNYKTPYEVFYGIITE